jgi:HicA toxin of bacterial toxin-antitoxin,
MAQALPLVTPGMDSARLFNRIAQGNSANIAFRDFARLLTHLGFVRRRTTGSHHIYAHPSVPELVNIQDFAGVAKPYQVKQVWALVERYNLRLEAHQ